ncbi:DUF6022 family protein [Paenibacillus sp. 481]|uniref:DUF6022 family protein n=1 Tax=Paenibacillus sp. 481 TaxID=2835869 RepID=UPI001E5A0498|nr:DUF6022 family protein [Paenibacillus sp. 481]UHA72501.1 hypothetical protein KIK04_17795 [Paenibacillus sp. 481]
MEPTNLLQAALDESGEARINSIARYMKEHIAANWDTVLVNHQDKLQRAYEEAGDMAYGTYCNLLFLQIHRDFKAAGLNPEPRFPGEFDISREWGSEQQDDQQRWMWSTVYGPNQEALGTIVTLIHHDHTQFRVPHQPGILALTAVGKEAVVEALSALSPEFAQALEFTVEYELYLQSQSQNQSQP